MEELLTVADSLLSLGVLLFLMLSIIVWGLYGYKKLTCKKETTCSFSFAYVDKEDNNLVKEYKSSFIKKGKLLASDCMREIKEVMKDNKAFASKIHYTSVSISTFESF